MKTFRIDRKKWLRGPNSANMLWNGEAGCCLGHVIHQNQRCTWYDLFMMYLPSDYYHNKSILTEDGKNNHLADEAMLFNDSDLFKSDRLREKHLRSLFKKHGYKLEFYN